MNKISHHLGRFLISKPVSIIEIFSSVFGLIGSIISTLKVLTTPDQIHFFWYLVFSLILLCLGLAGKMIKFKLQSGYDLQEFASRAHVICHTMREKYLYLFDHWHEAKNKGTNKIGIDINETRTSLAKDCAMNLLEAIHKATQEETHVVVKIFPPPDVSQLFADCIEYDKSGNKKQVITVTKIFNALEESDTQLDTICVCSSKPQETKTSRPILLKEHYIYRYALSHILGSESGCFIVSNTKKYVTNKLKKRAEGSIFKHPSGHHELKNKKLCKLDEDMLDWFNEQKGIIVVPISNERDQLNNEQKAKIYGMIKISVKSNGAFAASSDLLAYVNLAKACGDTMYKCIERLDFYQRGVVCA